MNRATRPSLRLTVAFAALVCGAAVLGIADAALALTEQQCVDFVRGQAALMYRVPSSNVDVKWYGPSLAELGPQLRSVPRDARISLGGSIYKLYGTMPVPLQIWDKGTKIATIYPRFQINVTQEVVVTTSRVPAGTLLDASTVRLEKRPVAAILSQPFTTLSGVLGTLARQDLPPGTILAANMIESPPIVKSGSPVSVRLVSGGLTILGSGEALQDGRKGQLVRVLNRQSRREFLARVAGPDMVEIELEEEGEE